MQTAGGKQLNRLKWGLRKEVDGPRKTPPPLRHLPTDPFCVPGDPIQAGRDSFLTATEIIHGPAPVSQAGGDSWHIGRDLAMFAGDSFRAGFDAENIAVAPPALLPVMPTAPAAPTLNSNHSTFRHAMPFDPTKPANGSALSSAEMRNQLTSLKTLIDNIPAGPEGPQGPPGEVTQAALDAAISGTSNNSNGVGTLAMSVSDPPSQAEVQQIADKVDELINALRR